MTDLDLMRLAEQAREKAYAPYSGFRVGAALLSKTGRVYLGCNIENAAYTPTNCAERTAFFKAVSEGERNFEAIAIVGGQGDSISRLCAPCGVCRQVMVEFCSPDFRVLLGNCEQLQATTLGELLPLSFSPKNLREREADNDENV
ncbi:MAG: cytidine deaminase [Ruminococcaceae bacterium]|nr:cytidine deaminase [Oscillospiraceae bacterium]